MNPPPEWASGLHTEKAKREFIRQLCRNEGRRAAAWVHAMPWEWTGRELRQFLVEMWATESIGLQGDSRFRGQLIMFRKEWRGIRYNHNPKEIRLAMEPRTLIRKNRWAKDRNRQ